MRRSLFFWTVLCATVVVGVFVIKHRVQALEDRLRGLNAEIISDQNSIRVLDAEWSFLNQPARLEQLSRKLLDMESPQPGQTMTMADFLQREDALKGDKDGADKKAGKNTRDRNKDAEKNREAPHRSAPAPRAAQVAERAAPVPVPLPAPPPPPARHDDEDWLKPILAKLKRPQ